MRTQSSGGWGPVGIAALVATFAPACQGERAEADLQRETDGSEESAPEPELVSFATSDDGLIQAHLYGTGPHGVVLAHGGVFDKESWAPQARVLAQAGLRVLAIDFRGYGESRGGSPSKDRFAGLYLDVLGAVRFLRDSGATTVSVVGGSMGGWAAAEAAAAAEPGQIDRLVLLAAASIEEPERMQGRKLFITTREDPRGGGGLRLPEIQDQYERASGPKELVILEGKAHAQHIFKSDQADRLLDEILRFLTAERSTDPGQKQPDSPERF